MYEKGGIFYAMWHPDRYVNSVNYDVRDPVDSMSGSSLMEHLQYIAHRNDMWYVANGWLYSYRMVAQNVQVQMNIDMGKKQVYSMWIENDNKYTKAATRLENLENGFLYYYRVSIEDKQQNHLSIPTQPLYRYFEVSE